MAGNPSFIGVFDAIPRLFLLQKWLAIFPDLVGVANKKEENNMEINLKKRFIPNRTLPMTKDRVVDTKIIGITSGNIAGTSVQPAAFERSREYLAHVAEVEIKRSLAQAEVYRLSLR